MLRRKMTREPGEKRVAASSAGWELSPQTLISDSGLPAIAPRDPAVARRPQRCHERALLDETYPVRRCYFTTRQLGLASGRSEMMVAAPIACLVPVLGEEFESPER